MQTFLFAAIVVCCRASIKGVDGSVVLRDALPTQYTSWQFC